MTDDHDYGVSARPGSLVDPTRYGWVACPGRSYQDPESGHHVDLFEHDSYPGYTLIYESGASSEELVSAMLESPDRSSSRIEPLRLTDALRWPSSMDTDAAKTEATERSTAASLAAQAAPPARPQTSIAAQEQASPRHIQGSSGREPMER